mmetsp:Transcript_26545/g.30371  ORF Transcript_26545/g.30371 Transcript_26545/m.30371 type:complete len:226 (+) Transcript_26545:186-863(+)
MKVLLFTIFATSQAFIQPSPSFSRLTSLNLERGDSSNAVQAALEASRLHGATSKEASVAWDIVEEIRASNNSAAYESSSHDVLADSSKNKEMYEKFLELQKLGELQKSHIESVKHVTDEIRSIKLTGPLHSSVRVKERLDNPILYHALTEAKSMTEQHGVTSPQAKLAWEAVENIASHDSSEVMKGALDDGEECLVEMIQACEAMEELNRALFLNENKASGRYHG